LSSSGTRIQKSTSTQPRAHQSLHETRTGSLIKTHPRKLSGKQTDLGDYPPERVAFHQRTPAWCRRQAEQIGLACIEVVNVCLNPSGFDGGCPSNPEGSVHAE
ncbi:hypothetical protein ACFQD1_59895, partial [Nonomuraea thailandensis]